MEGASEMNHEGLAVIKRKNNTRLALLLLPCRAKDASDSDYEGGEAEASDGSGDEVGEAAPPQPQPPLESEGLESEEGSKGDRLRPDHDMFEEEDEEQAEADRAVEVSH